MKSILAPILYTTSFALLASAEDPAELRTKQSKAAFTCSASNDQVKTLNAGTRAPVLFCMWWRGNNDNKSKASPFAKLTNHSVDQTCKCILSSPSIGKTTMPAATSGSSKVKNLIDLENDVANPLTLCKYWLTGSTPKDASPFIDIAPSELTPLCKQVVANPKLVTTTKGKGSGSGAKTSSGGKGKVTSAAAGKATKKGGATTTPKFATMTAAGNGTVATPAAGKKSTAKTTAKIVAKTTAKLTTPVRKTTSSKTGSAFPATTTEASDDNGSDSYGGVISTQGSDSSY